MDSTLPPRGGDFRLIASGTRSTKLGKWKIVKNFSTRLTVLRRFGVKYRIETTWVEIQCSLSSELAVGSTQTQLEKSKPSENTETKSRPRRHEIRKARDVCKDLAFDRVAFYPFLLTFIGIQALKDPLAVISITKVVAVITVTVWFFNQITAKKQFLLLCYFSLIVHGVHAEDLNENCKAEDPIAWETHDYAEAAAVTLLAFGLAIGGAGVARRMCNLWRPLAAAVVALVAPAALPAAVPAPAALPAAVPAPAALPAAVPAPAAPGAQAAPVPAFDIMGGLFESPVPTRCDSTFDIPPEL